MVILTRRRMAGIVIIFWHCTRRQRLLCTVPWDRHLLSHPGQQHWDAFFLVGKVTPELVSLFLEVWNMLIHVIAVIDFWQSFSVPKNISKFNITNALYGNRTIYNTFIFCVWVNTSCIKKQMENKINTQPSYIYFFFMYFKQIYYYRAPLGSAEVKKKKSHV